MDCGHLESNKMLNVKNPILCVPETVLAWVLRHFVGGTPSRIVGTPVFVVEILSPSTTANDTIRKLNLYQRTKVQEYWIVESDEKIVNVYLHDGTLLRWTAAYRPGETLSPSMFMDLKMNVSDIF